MWYAGMFRLQREKPYVVVGDVRSVHLPRLLGGAPQPRCAPYVRALHAAGHQLDMETAQKYAAWRELERCMFNSLHHISLVPSDSCLHIIMVLQCTY